MGNVYLTKKNGGVVIHTDKQAMKEMDGIEKPDMTVTEAEFEAAGGLVRIINNKIFLGKTEEEKTAEEGKEKVIALKRQLAETDYIATKIAEGAATKADYAEVIAQRESWRKEIRKLST